MKIPFPFQGLIMKNMFERHQSSPISFGFIKHFIKLLKSETSWKISGLMNAL